jgi:hypothetical protein
MASKKSKEPTACDGGSLGTVQSCPALNASEDKLALPTFQAQWIARRFRVPPARAMLIAALAFEGCV